MRILHVLDHSLPLHSGYAFRTAAIVREQRALGFETYQLTTPRHRHTSPSIDETVDGIRFLRTPCDRGWRSKVPAWGTYLEEMRATRRRIEELVEQLKPDVVHAHSPILTALPTMAATRRRRVPFVYEVRALWEDGAVSHGTTRPDSMRYRATRHLETLVLRRASHVTTICSGLAGEIASRGVDASRITVIPNAVDADAFRFNPPRDERLAQQLALRDAYVLGFQIVQIL